MTKKLLVLALSAALAACGGSENQAPIFTSDAQFQVNEDVSLNGQLAATDQEGESLSFSLQTPAQNGVMQLNADGSFVYTPKADFFGDDSVTVAVSDGVNTVSQTLNFSVTGVNDLPVLVNQSVAVTSSSTSKGQLQVTDVDGDTITFALVSQPSSGLVELDTATGAFQFVANELEVVSGSFDVSFTDGVIAEPIVATIELKPSYVTNLDKANYYYASAQSHLKQAEAIKAELNDDVEIDGLNALLAQGYFGAGFDDKAKSLIDEIILADEKAKAYYQAASQQYKQGDTGGALESLQNSLSNYNQFIATKGLDNIASDDVPFFLSLVNLYSEMDMATEADQLFTTLQIYADAVREEQYSTTYGRFLTAFWFYAEDLSIAYFNDKTEQNLQKAKQATIKFAELTKQTGYQTETRGTYVGQNSKRLKALYVSRAADMLFNIGAIEEAKDYTNFALSLYGIANFDTDYAYEADVDSEVTLAVYDYPVATIAGLVTGLYPEQTTNPAFDLLTSSFDIANAKRAMFAKSILNQVEAGIPATEAVIEAQTYFAEDNSYRDLYQTLVEYVESEPRAGHAMLLRNGPEAAKPLFDIAANLLVSEAYVTNETSTSYLTGYRGCARLTQLYLQAGYDAQAMAKRCETMVHTYFNDDAALFSTSKTITAYLDLLGTFDMVGDTESIKANIPALLAQIAKYDDEDIATSGLEKVKLATRLIKFGLADESKTILAEGLAQLRQASESDLTGVIALYSLSIQTDWLVDNGYPVTGFWETPSYLNSLSQQASTLENYADFYAEIMTIIRSEVAYYTDSILALSDNQIIGAMEDLIAANTVIQNTAKVDELINHEVNSGADIDAFKALHAGLLATRDNFSNTNVASVDTDNDGLPNFFNPAASEAQIAASGLVADTDADNDGIEDSQDAQPLIKN